MTKQVQQSITPTHVIGSTGTADTSDLGYRALDDFKDDLGLGDSLTQTANNGNGTAADPAFTFTGDPDTGIFRPAADELGFVTNGSEKVRIDDTGNVGIGTSSPSAKLHVNGEFLVTEGASFRLWLPNDNMSQIGSAAGFDFRIRTGSTEHMRITDAGNVGIGTGAPATRLHVDGTIRYTNRPAAGTITAIGFDTNGDLKESSSSLRHKHDIEDYDKGLTEVMQLRPVSFKFNGEDITNIGFIAEEVDALGMTEVMLYDEEQRPNAISYANMVSLLTKAIQEQQSIINELKVRIETMESIV